MQRLSQYRSQNETQKENWSYTAFWLWLVTIVVAGALVFSLLIAVLWQGSESEAASWATDNNQPMATIPAEKKPVEKPFAEVSLTGFHGRNDGRPQQALKQLGPAGGEAHRIETGRGRDKEAVPFRPAEAEVRHDFRNQDLADQGSVGIVAVHAIRSAAPDPAFVVQPESVEEAIVAFGKDVSA